MTINRKDSQVHTFLNHQLENWIKRCSSVKFMKRGVCCIINLRIGLKDCSSVRFRVSFIRCVITSIWLSILMSYILYMIVLYFDKWCITHLYADVCICVLCVLVTTLSFYVGSVMILDFNGKLWGVDRWVILY